MKKILLMFGCLLLVVGCSCSNDKAADAVEKYLNDYKGLSDHVLEDIDELVEAEKLTDKGKETYKEVLKRQYRDCLSVYEAAIVTKRFRCSTGSQLVRKKQA